MFAAILLGSVKAPYEEIKRRIVEMDEQNLTEAMIEQLLKYLPRPEQMTQLAGLKDEFDNLAEAEQFGVVVSSDYFMLCLSYGYNDVQALVVKDCMLLGDMSSSLTPSCCYSSI